MAAPLSSSVFSFRHPLLTPIVGKPTVPTVTQLKKEILANARSVHCSTGGGGTNDFLGIVMAPAPYILRAGEAFVPPTHPGNQPNHLPTATQSQITAANRQYDNLLESYCCYTQVREAATLPTNSSCH
jgi:hypothetical protein